MNRVLLILLLVSVLGSRGKSVSNSSQERSRTFNHLALRDDSKPQTEVSKDELLGQGSPTVSTSVSQEDRDPIESSDTIVYNRFEKPSSDQSNDSEEEKEDQEDEEPEGPPDHVIPRSEHEEPRNVPTKPRYTAPGEWAKPAKKKEVALDFVPTRVYAQVRKTDTVRRLPRKKAIENAVSDEEKENAARLRAVVKNTKVNTVYTEEGYEDSAYDHAGHIRDADFQEDYDRKLHDQLDLRKKSGDDDYDDDDDEREENETRDSKYTKTSPNKFKDFDELDTGRRETDDNFVVSAKLVAEKETEKLQADLEKEAEEMEKGIEISKVEKVRKTNDREATAESAKRRRKTRKRHRRPLVSNDIENSTAVSNGDGIPTDTEIETATKKLGSRGSSRLHGVHGNTSSNDLTDFEGSEVDPTTVSYSQIFWDYFKTKDNQTTTELPVVSETTTLNENLLQDPSFKGTMNNLIPQSSYEETTTPTIDSEYLPAQQSDGQTSVDSEYSKNINMDELWQPNNSNEAIHTETSPFSNNYNDELYAPIRDASIPNLEAALDSNEEFDKNFDSSLFNPTLNSVANRRPRYKITIRHKSGKPEKSSTLETPDLESSTPKPTIKPSTESTTVGGLTMSENYMKVLMHVKNEKNSGKYSHPRNSLQRNNGQPSNHKNELEDLTRMRPPLPQTPYYYSFIPRSHPEAEGPQLDWSSFPVSQRHHQAYTAPRIYQIYSDSPYPVQRPPFNRKRNSIPGLDLIRVPPRSDLYQTSWHTDYVSRAGNRSKQTRNVPRVRGIRAKRRERRSATQVASDESGADVKGPRSMANNGTSNGGEIERARKNPSIERNCWQKVRRSLEVGLALDTWPAKQPGEKKSRHCATDRGEGSRAVERESSSVHGDQGDVDLAALSYDAGKKDGGNAIDSTGKKEEKPGDKDSQVKDLLDEKLLNEAPEVAKGVVDKEIDARFNGDEEDEEEEDEEENVEVEVPEFDYVEESIEEDRAEAEIATTKDSLDHEKYPFYNEKMPTPSALKYATDPKRLPAKTFGAMEFYNSRDAYKHCDEVEPKLEVLPEEEEPVPERGPKKNLPRLRGLGDKLDCFKAKYFDDNPFDNPLFLEKEVEAPVAPSEINSKQFTSRIMMFPKENDDFVIQKLSKRPENYRQSRRHGSARPQGRRRIRYKSYPRTTARSRKRPQSFRVQTSQIKFAKGSRRPERNEKREKNERNEKREKNERKEKRPVTSASELSSMYTPYQSQVYEDVMGTIKNLANSYQVHEITTMPGSEEITLVEDASNAVRVNSSKNSTKEGRKDKHRVSIDILDQPSNVDINIKGLMPPQYRSRQRGGYKRTRVPQKTRPRIQVQKPVIGYRTVKRRRKVRVYKRDLRDTPNFSNEESLLVASIELDSAEKKGDDEERLQNSRESDHGLKNSQNSTVRPVADEETSTKASTVSKTANTQRKLKVPETLFNDTTQREEKSQKVVYTIKDRIRYSKPKGDVRKLGKFSKETKTEETSRRKEPRYNYIRRKSSPSPTITTTENSLYSLTTEIDSSDTTTTTERNVELDGQIVAKENREVKYSIDHTKDKLNVSENRSDQDQVLSNEPTTNKTGTGYAVHENVNEDEATTTESSKVSSSTEYFNLKTYLEADPEKFAGLSSEDLEKPYPYSVNNNSSDFDGAPDSINSNATVHEDGKDEETSKTSYPSRFSEEESSEKLETSTKAQPSRESSDESNAPSKESESEEYEPFFAYTSRPSSPAENYEDEKYADLGPRVNKPAFYHPPFADYNKSHPKGSSEESQESTEVKEEYVFPWYKDKEDRRKRNRHRGNLLFEYPWERRERLAREEKRRKEEKRKGLLKSFDDEDEETEEATKPRRNVYPRGRYRYWGRRDRDTSEDRSSDNLESSSEYRPVMKYSSRYRSKNVSPSNENSTTVRSNDVEEISRSIKKVLEEDSEEKGSSKEEEVESSSEKTPETSAKYRGISRGMIVPEDVTLAPTRKTKSREQPRAKDGIDALESRKSSEVAKNTLENSESRMTAVTPGPRGTENSAKQGTKKRRRPLKNAISTVESATEASLARRRQKSATTTPTTISSASTAGTVPASRVARRRNHKSGSDPRKTGPSKAPTRSSNDATERDSSTSRTGTVEQRSRGRKRSRTNEIVNEPTKNPRDRELAKSSRKQDQPGKVNEGGEKGLGEKEANRTAKPTSDDAGKNEEAGEPRRIIPTVKSDVRFDFEDDRVETLSDVEKPDDDYEFGAVLKTEANFTPQNRALQLTEQSSREIVSSVSWISENYDF